MTTLQNRHGRRSMHAAKESASFGFADSDEKNLWGGRRMWRRTMTGLVSNSSLLIITYSMMFLALAHAMRAGAGESTQDRPPQLPTPRQTSVSFRLREEKVGGEEEGRREESAYLVEHIRALPTLLQELRLQSRAYLSLARDDKGHAARCGSAMNDRIRICLRTPVPTAPRPRPRPRTGSASSAPREVRHAVRGLGVHGQPSTGAANSGARDYGGGGELHSVIPHPPSVLLSPSGCGDDELRTLLVRKVRRKGPGSYRYAGALSERIALARAPLAV